MCSMAPDTKCTSNGHRSTLFFLKKLDTTHIKDDLKETAVGKRGEEWAWLYLRSVYGDASVNWINNGRETGKPYDISVVHIDGTTQYVEVKATKKDSYQTRFVVSRNELKHARNNINTTEFYFVVNVEADKPELYRVMNWRRHWAIRLPESKLPKQMRFEKECLKLAPLGQLGYDHSKRLMLHPKHSYTQYPQYTSVCLSGPQGQRSIGLLGPCPPGPRGQWSPGLLGPCPPGSPGPPGQWSPGLLGLCPPGSPGAPGQWSTGLLGPCPPVGILGCAIPYWMP